MTLKSRINRTLVIFIFSFLLCSNLSSQTLIPFQFVNNSPDFVDDEIYIGLIGKTAELGDVWIDFKTNSSTNSALIKMSAADNTLHKVSGDWGYAPIFTKLSDIADRTIYIPKILGCKLFIGFKHQLYIHFHETGGYAGISLQNPSDPNTGIRFESIEITNASNGLWVNTTRVDSYQYPMGLEVLGKSGTNYIYNKVGDLLTHQAIIQRWQNTFTNTEFLPCYVTSLWQNDPLGGIIMQPSKIQQFSETGVSKNYFQDYIDRIWNYYATNELVVSLADRGVYRGKVENNILKMVSSNGIQAWINGKPNTQEVIEGKGKIAEDVLATPDKDADLALQSQFCAAINRGAIDLTIPGGQNQDWSNKSKYFVTDIHNRYVWFFHQNDISYNSKTYAFAYDDVYDNSSVIQSTYPEKVKIIVGGFANLTTDKPLTSFAVTPADSRLTLGSSLQFTSVGYVANDVFPVSISPTWTSSGGTIDNSGYFTPNIAGDYTITATVGTLQVTAKVKVTEPIESDCVLNSVSGNFAVTFSKDKTNPTFTFVPTITGTGDNTCLLFYSKIANNWNNVGANAVKPNVPFKITANQGDKIYFYYAYSLADGGAQQNSLAANDSYIVGSCGATSGVTEYVADSNFELYPNPTKNVLNIKIKGNFYYNITLYDLSGRVMICKNTKPDQSQLQLDIQKLKNGIYFIVLNGQNGTKGFKFEKKY
ncbi:MAG: beta-1,3-glucanase family protein [Bacteroidota bacterium]|nr:beta-1,3-glucanase family protein [Bacteroidota bacterium]